MPGGRPRSTDGFRRNVTMYLDLALFKNYQDALKNAGMKSASQDIENYMRNRITELSGIAPTPAEKDQMEQVKAKAKEPSVESLIRHYNSVSALADKHEKALRKIKVFEQLVSLVRKYTSPAGVVDFAQLGELEPKVRAEWKQKNKNMDDVDLFFIFLDELKLKRRLAGKLHSARLNVTTPTNYDNLLED